ncbi:MAG: glycosyltransferase family 9 protein [Candidatus Latescibacteria bacterium]|nr:glycosyltransferase family 9 protein [Candidatus Latescibacterota bacterium]
MLRVKEHRAPRLLVVRPDRVGDVVLSTPVLRALRRQWPEAYLAMLVRPYSRDVLVANPWLDEILTDEADGSDRGVVGFMRQVGRLRTRRFDVALMLLPTMRIAWMLFLAGIPHRVGVGRTMYQALTLTRSVSRRRYIPLRHEADYCLDLARAIGVETEDVRPAVFLTEAEREAARSLLRAEGATDRPLIGLHPGNGRNAPNWPPETYGTLADRMAGRWWGATLLVTGSAAEQGLIDRMRTGTTARLVSLAGRLDLRQLMAVIAELDLLVSSSTGPMHLAAALGVPTVSLFCPLPARSPGRWGPLSARSIVLLPPGHGCETCERGPMCDLAGISVETVVEAVARTLAVSPSIMKQD